MRDQEDLLSYVIDSTESALMKIDGLLDLPVTYPRHAMSIAKLELQQALVWLKYIKYDLGVGKT